MRPLPFFLVVLIAILPIPKYLAAQTAAYKTPGSLYTQDFDGLPVTGSFTLSGKGPFSLSDSPVAALRVEGWQIWQYGGSGKNAALLPGTGSSTGQGIYSLGLTGATDRALGSLSSGSGIYAFGLLLSNQTGSTLTNCTIRFTAEQWRKGGSGNLNTWQFFYHTGEISTINDTPLIPEPSGNFSSIQTSSGGGSLNGNLPANRQPYTIILKNMNWQPGQQLLVRWDDADDSGSDDVMALDDFSLIAGNDPAPPTADKIEALKITDTSLLLQALIHTNGNDTHVQLQYDTATHFLNPLLLTTIPDLFPAGNNTDTLTTGMTGLKPSTQYAIRLIVSSIAGADTVLAMFKTEQKAAPPAMIKDTIPPQLIRIQFPAEGIYASSDTLQYVFQFSEPVYISDSIPLSCKITIGTKTRYAAYQTGNGTTELMFRYSIVPGDKDADGVKTATLTGETEPTDSSGNSASVTGKQFSSPNRIFVDAVQPEISEVIVPEAGDYFTGDTLWFEVHFTKSLRPLTGTKPVYLPLQIGKTTVNALLYATNDTALFFYCPLADSYWDTSGISFAGSLSDSLVLLKDTPGNIALLSLHHAGSMRDIRIHPGIIEIKALIAPAAGWYRQGDSLHFTLAYSESAFLQPNSSVPSIDFTVNGSSKRAIYQYGSGSSDWHFLYIVPTGLSAPDGIRVTESVHQTKNSIRDKWGNPAPIAIPQMPDGRYIRIDALASVIDNTDLPQDGLYGLGKQLFVTVHFSEPVFLTSPSDSVYLVITIGTTQRKMLPLNGIGTDTWQFVYVIQPGDLDKNGILFSGNLYYSPAAPVDAAGNTVNPALHLSASSAGIWVDGYSPRFIQAVTDTLRYCADTAPIFLNEVFGIADDETGELVTWRIITAPHNGTFSLSDYSKNTTGNQLLPQGWQYQPSAGWTGIDSLETEVTDGVNTIRKKILMQIYPPIRRNNITGSQVICSGTKPDLITGTIPEGGYVSYHYTWEISQLNETDGYSASNDSSDLQTLSLPAIIPDTWIRRRIYSGNCQQVSDPVFIHTRQAGIWLGQSADWQDTANWCGHALPDATTDVLLQKQALFSPAINSKAFCKDLWIAYPKQLAVTGSLAITGNIHADHASVNAYNGSLSFNGNQVQSLSGNWLVDHAIGSLFMENPQGLILQDSVVLQHSLKMRAGTILTNNELHLMPDAFMEPAAKQTALAGKISLSYRFSNKQPLYYLLQHPFQEDMDWRLLSKQITLTGPGGAVNGFQDAPGNPVSLYHYNNLSGNDSADFEMGWRPVYSITADSSVFWESHQPIGLQYQGMRDSSAGGYSPDKNCTSCITLSGTILTGDAEKSIPQGQAGRFIIAGNPYIANIDPARVTRSGNIGRYYWRWLQGQGKHGGYTVYPFDNSQSIKPWETLIVQVCTNDPAQLFFTEQTKTENNPTDKIQTAEPYNGFHLELQIWQDSICLDRLLILSMDSARTGIDLNDAPKIKNPDFDFYSISRDGHRLSADARSLTTNANIPLGIRSVETGQFSIVLADAYLPAGNLLQLHDIFANRWIPLIKGSAYYFTITSDTASQGDQRFELAVPVTVTTRQMNKEGIRIKLSPVPARESVQLQYAAKEAGNCELRITDAAGKVCQAISLGQQKDGNIRISLSTLPSGVYYVQLRIGESIATAGFIRQ